MSGFGSRPGGGTQGVQSSTSATPVVVGSLALPDNKTTGFRALVTARHLGRQAAGTLTVAAKLTPAISTLTCPAVVSIANGDGAVLEDGTNTVTVVADVDGLLISASTHLPLSGKARGDITAKATADLTAGQTWTFPGGAIVTVDKAGTTFVTGGASLLADLKALLKLSGKAKGIINCAAPSGGVANGQVIRFRDDAAGVVFDVDGTIDWVAETGNSNVPVCLSGKGRSAFQVVAAVNYIDGETITVDDGVNPPFIGEFDVGGFGNFPGGGGDDSTVQLNLVGAVTAGDVRDIIIAAANDAGVTLAATAATSAAGTNIVSFTRDSAGLLTLSDTVAAGGFQVYAADPGGAAVTTAAGVATKVAYAINTLAPGFGMTIGSSGVAAAGRVNLTALAVGTASNLDVTTNATGFTVAGMSYGAAAAAVTDAEVATLLGSTVTAMGTGLIDYTAQVDGAVVYLTASATGTGGNGMISTTTTCSKTNPAGGETAPTTATQVAAKVVSVVNAIGAGLTVTASAGAGLVTFVRDTGGQLAGGIISADTGSFVGTNVTEGNSAGVTAGQTLIMYGVTAEYTEGGAVSVPGRTQIDIADIYTAAAVRDRTITRLNAVTAFGVVAASGGGSTVDIERIVPGTAGNVSITGTSAALTLAGGARYPGPAGKSKKKHKPQVVLTDGSVEPVEALQERQKPKPVRIEVEDFEAPAMPSLLGPFVPPEFRDWMPKTSSGRSYKSLVEEDDDEVLLLL